MIGRNKRDEVWRLRRLGVSYREIARRVRISKGSVANILKEREKEKFVLYCLECDRVIRKTPCRFCAERDELRGERPPGDYGSLDLVGADLRRYLHVRALAEAEGRPRAEFLSGESPLLQIIDHPVD